MTSSVGLGSARGRPRILIDAIAYSPRDGGFTTALHDLLDTCRRLPEFEFVVVHDRRYGSVIRGFGLATYSVVIPKRLRWFASLVLLPLIARRIKATAVHCEISALPWALGVPGSVTVHDLYFLIDAGASGRTLSQRLMQVYWRRVFVPSVRLAAIVKAISETTADDLRRLVSSTLPIVIGAPRFQAPAGAPKAGRAPSHSKTLRLLFVGSVVPRRNLPFLLQSLQLVRRPWQLDVVGSLWWGRDELGSLVRDKRVQFHGYVLDAEREKLMADAHLLVAPSLYEGFGYPAAEAMIRGLPVISSDVGAFREFVPSESRFPLGDPGSLASMIDAFDEVRSGEMARTGRDAVSRFTLQNHLESHRALFGQLVSGPWGAALPSARDRLRWRPGKLDRMRALARRILTSTLGDRGEGRLRGSYHGVLRRAGRFGPPESAATKQVLAAIAARSRTMIDVGANVGRYSWFLLKHASSNSMLFALEPHPDTARLLRGTVGVSPRCAVLEVAASDRDGIAELVVPIGAFGSDVSALAWMRAQSGDHDPHALPVATRRIDGLIQDGTISVAGPVFMKIDVEGAEGRVLRGAAALLERYRPVLYFECQSPSLARQAETPERVWSELARSRYRVFVNRANRFVPVDRIEPDDVNYLAIPGLVGEDGRQSLDTDGMIAIIDTWATRGSEG